MAFLKQKLKANWFLYGIIAAIFFAKSWPSIGMKGGPLKPEITIKYVAISIIFFNSGLSLKTEELTTALKQLNIHVFIQGFTFIIIPVFVYALRFTLSYTFLNENLLQGLTVLSCMPPPVSSAVILTKAIGGNEAAAIFNSAFGSFLGIGISPLLLLIFMGDTGSVPFSDVFLTLGVTVVLPIILGQFARQIHDVRNFIEAKKPPFRQIGSFILLMIIYTTFCDTFGAGDIDVELSSLLLIVLIILFVQILLLSLTFYLSSNTLSRLYSPADTVCIMFCSTHKSLTLGIPMLKIIYAGSPALSFLTIPLLVYHPTQILLGGLLVPFIKSWLTIRQSEGYLPLHAS